jgi:hypothetical protein
MRIGRRNFCYFFIRISVVLDKAPFEHVQCALSVYLGVYPGSPYCPWTLLAHLHFLSRTTHTHTHTHRHSTRQLHDTKSPRKDENGAQLTRLN